MKVALKDRYYNVGKDRKYLIKKLSQAKASGIKLSEVHGIDNGIDRDVKPERQVLKIPNPTVQPNHQNKPRLGQGRVGLRRKTKAPIQVQTQVQSRNVNPIKEQTLLMQKEGIQTPLTKPTTNRHIGQRPEHCITCN